MNGIFALLVAVFSPILIGPRQAEPPHTPVQQQDQEDEVVYFDAPLYQGDVVYRR